MGPNLIFFGWNRSIPGRESMGAEHFQDFTRYLTGLQQEGRIESFDTVFLSTHGGDMNGFFLIRGDSAKLDEIVSTTEWVGHMIRADMHLEGSGAVRGHTGDLIQEIFGIWSNTIPA
jgi:hypothetical protein